MQVLLRHGADRKPAGFTELMWAIALGSVEDVDRELHRGADLAARDYWEMTPWLLSLSTGDVDKAGLLLSAGAKLDDRGRCGKTNLMYAVSCNHAAMTRWLLAHNTDPNATDDFGNTPLMSAAEHGHADLMLLLLSAGADIEAVGESDRTALFYAAAPEGFTAFRLMQESHSQDWPALLEVLEGLDPKLMERMRGTVNELKSRGVELASSDYGYQPSDDVTAIEILVRSGANVEARDEEGLTPLLLAARCGRPSRAAALLRLDANVDARDDEGKSAAEQVASHHDPEQGGTDSSDSEPLVRVDKELFREVAGCYEVLCRSPARPLPHQVAGVGLK